HPQLRARGVRLQQHLYTPHARDRGLHAFRQV
ncbi:hypothetical protein AK812_SmicGene47622, partial [Symbiodinium microadriaticum]